MLLKAVHSKGLGKKIDPNKGSIAAPSASVDLTASLNDELLLLVLAYLSDDPYLCSLVCKLHGMLKLTLRLKEWRAHDKEVLHRHKFGFGRCIRPWFHRALY
ncbi:hypothetical protein GOP47_0001719 [Adiantum capillus-veneris]|uniref:Uncharacterized protein n=1 Tax=Adiantum capillus-veneris TaxID=13818 RepID=A0A9D4V8S5_ADICA|nr:hypothetical protein GOP47_0001719 [Adiantum capillus-veneris]